jgi:hypothetical protein
MWLQSLADPGRCQRRNGKGSLDFSPRVRLETLPLGTMLQLSSACVAGAGAVHGASTRCNGAGQAYFRAQCDAYAPERWRRWHGEGTRHGSWVAAEPNCGGETDAVAPWERAFAGIGEHSTPSAIPPSLQPMSRVDTIERTATDRCVPLPRTAPRSSVSGPEARRLGFTSRALLSTCCTWHPLI